MLFYYFEVDTEYSIIKSPSESPKIFILSEYSIKKQHKIKRIKIL